MTHREIITNEDIEGFTGFANLVHKDGNRVSTLPIETAIEIEKNSPIRVLRLLSPTEKIVNICKERLGRGKIIKSVYIPETKETHVYIDLTP
jgi:hypothetical protein